ncbi:hypothetical protein ES705_36042 [subsurface metagenome]
MGTNKADVVVITESSPQFRKGTHSGKSIGISICGRDQVTKRRTAPDIAGRFNTGELSRVGVTHLG